MRHLNPMKRQNWVVWSIWIALWVAFGFALRTLNWSLAFLAAATFGLSLLPAFFADRFGIRLPTGFYAAITLFIFGTIFLGEAYDFYERYWWWDVMLHGGSAIGFGILGFIFMLMLFEGDRYAAPAWAIAFFAFCFAMMIGAIWEIFEFTMDQLFNMNMQKSGLVDTMWDFIVDAIGAFVGAGAGYAYLRGRRRRGLPGQIAEFIARNRPWFRRAGKD